ncbi:PAS domain S-box-containing protein/diguanylate cyclase (GGDEF) domain-containing protein [Allochromatium warmingii]|uniref:diguanylate cyclase n=1 Tax=Allochromatium warmingii TaxID=61595 RepID=A0A1H3B535_ALLWA|nr:diguanylate cyclase [Allochromatium warmingii]SDX37042.1 PAS domain S-box-containing protein/diguanylate cyclase (GGDEF) domain-containing protein [Allochromatium warmingii]
MYSNYVILCIDDEETILDSLSMELSGRFAGVELELVQDNAEAEELARDLIAEGREIPVVVCDYIMPGRKGDAVLAAIHAIAPKARTVMLTGQSSLDGVTNAINRADLYRYIAKPWDRDDLILTLRGALESYVQDATIERQNAELKELNQGLEQKVIERTAELQAANAELADANRTITQYLDIIDQHVLICRIDKAGIITYASAAFCRRSGFERAELIGHSYLYTLYSNLSEARIQDITATLERGETWQGEIRHQSKDGEYYWVHEIISPDLVNESFVLGFTSIRQDITDKKAVEELSITDALTGLYNRRHFNSVLEQELDRARLAKQWLAFAMFDVDHFKLYNDNYGHAAGDEVLKRIGQLLNTRYRRGRDYVFRIGGEEFAVLILVRHPEEAETNAAGLVAAIEALALPHGHSPVSSQITISLGLRLISPDEPPVTVDQVFTEADTRLYRAKESGRNRYVL